MVPPKRPCSSAAALHLTSLGAWEAEGAGVGLTLLRAPALAPPAPALAPAAPGLEPWGRGFKGLDRRALKETCGGGTVGRRRRLT